MNPTLRVETLMLCAIRHERTRTRRSVAYSANDAHDGGCSQFPGWAKGDAARNFELRDVLAGVEFQPGPGAGTGRPGTALNCGDRPPLRPLCLQELASEIDAKRPRKPANIDKFATLFHVQTMQTTPKGLKSRGRACWRAVTTEFELDPAERELLRELCVTLDEIDALATALRTSELVVEGSRGQPRTNPLLGELRTHRKLADALVLSLALPLDIESVGARRSGQARQAARARWRNGKGI